MAGRGGEPAERVGVLRGDDEIDLVVSVDIAGLDVDRRVGGELRDEKAGPIRGGISGADIPADLAAGTIDGDDVGAAAGVKVGENDTRGGWEVPRRLCSRTA